MIKTNFGYVATDKTAIFGYQGAIENNIILVNKKMENGHSNDHFF